MSGVLRRGVCVIGMAASVLILFELRQLPGAWNWLSLRTVAACGTALFAMVCAVLLFAGPGWLAPLTVLGRRIHEAAARSPDDSVRVGWALTGFAGVVFVVLSFWQRPLQTVDVASDQLAFVATAQDVHQTGGALSLLAQLWSGEYREANRHPLFIALLALHPTRAFGQSVAGFFGLLTVLTVAVRGRQIAGFVVSGVAALLLATNGAFVELSNQSVCESLLCWLVTLVWLVLLKWQNQTRMDDAPVARQEPFFATDKAARDRGLRFFVVLAGSLLGLAWLTKGTALPVLVATLVWLAVAARRGGRWIAGPLLLAGFLVVASPLIARNVFVWGSPFYNVNSWLMFEDSFSDPVKLAEEKSLSVAAQAYWQSHSVMSIGQRMVRGSLWELFILLRTLGPVGLGDARVLPGAMFAVLAVIGMIGRPRAEVGLLVFWLVFSLPLFAWYVPIAAGDRFVMPFAIPLLMYAARGGVLLWPIKGGQRAASVGARQA